MTSSAINRVGKGATWIPILLFAFVLSLLNAAPAYAEDCVGDFGGVLDGFVTPIAPSQIQIDGNCTIRNYPPSNPMSTNFSFLTQPGQTDERWLVVFDNVTHTGQMSCNSVQGHKVWFTNGSSTGIHANCQNLFIPVEKINKQNPAGQTTATVGVPFTYKLTSPVLFDPLSGTVTNNNGSPNDLHGVTMWDDLNDTGADLSYVSHTAYWLSDGTPISHTFSNVGGLLTFDNFPIIPAGRQFVIEITVVLRDTPANVVGTQFINTAKWDFGRLIAGVFYDPLPGEWGVTPPLTIAGPVLITDKTGPAAMNLGQWGDFVINVQNTGLSGAWNTAIRDVLPDLATGGMCDLTPQIQSVQVFAADGVTPIPGKGPLTAGSGYSVSYSGAPNCQLDITLLTAAGTIGPSERLVIRYRTQLDTNTQNGVPLTNVAGAIQWFNGPSSASTRLTFNRSLTNGTVGTVDHEDAHTVNAALTGQFFQKTAANLTSGTNPATTAAPGDRMRYTLRVRTTDQPLTSYRVLDEVDGLNTTPAFVPGTLALVTTPPGADTSSTIPNGGSKGTGVVDVRNLTVPANSEIVIQYDVTLATTLSNGTVVTNQAILGPVDTFNWPYVIPVPVTSLQLSDDPNVNGIADPNIANDDDPTRVTIVASPSTRYFFEKTAANLTSGANPATVAAPGDRLRYTLRVRTLDEALTNFRIFDDVDVLNTGSAFVPGTLALASYPAGADVSGTSGTGGVNGGGVVDIRNVNVPVGSDVLIQFDITLASTLTNGYVVTNQSALRLGDGTAFAISDNPNVNGIASSDVAGDEDPTRVTIVAAPQTSYLFEKTVANVTSGVSPATTAGPGDRLRYTLRLRPTNQAFTNFRILDDLGALNAGPAFVPGTLTLVAFPSGADASGTSGTGGANGTGLIDIRNVNVPAGGDAVIQFEITLASTLTNGTVVSNQATLRLADDTVFASSDDPGVNGASNPTVSGDEDPTRVTIVSAPLFRTHKISTDLTGDPNVLIAGETLRYTITVQNIGNVNALNVVLRDLVPVNTTYVTGSTTLNGAAVADAGGLSPLVNGMPINSPADTTPGSMPAGASSQVNVATITFNVVVDPNVVNGTVISNQGFVTAIDNNIVDHPSDDPDTPTANDPTRDIVGNVPLLYAEKSVVLFNDLGSPGIVDPGDVLRYTITVQNSAPIAATGLTLSDNVPANTTYVANSTVLNGSPVGQPDGGVSPLASGISINSTGAASGTIAPSASAVVQLDLRVNLGTPAGTVISNQAMVDSTELPNLLTDGDGNPGTGPEPTVVVVGAGQQQLSITKQVAVVGGGAALPGAELEYVVRVTNNAPAAATNVVITDDLNGGQLTYVSGSATMNGSASGVTFSGSTITANYAGVSGSLASGESVVLRFRATLAAGLAEGTVVTNTGVVSWNQPTQTESASASITIAPQPAPVFQTHKISTDLTGDPNVLIAGETLRYTITVQNIGNVNAANVVLRDLVPVNTTYVAGSTTLNGAAVADAGGLSPLVNGMPINSPADATPGSMPAGATSQANVATITFNVVVDPNVVNGTVISNQGFVSAIDSNIVDQPSDDPDTPTANDPTRDIVGNMPLLYAEKSVALFNDLGSPGIVDPGDVLRYTITVQNSAPIAATGLTLSDNVPANTTYVANSTVLNGSPVGQPDGGVSPLASGISINSTGAAAGTIAPSASAVVQFDLRVNLGTPAGTVISNQAMVDSTELPNLLTDGDGNPGTGPEPTVVVVGAGQQQLSITKQVAVVGGGAALPGAELEYVVRVTNNAPAAATNVVITDDLNGGQLTYVSGSATMNGSASGVTFSGSTITANYAGVSGSLASGESVVLRFRATLAAGLAEGTVVTNTGVVSWNQPTQTESASASIAVGGVPGFTTLSGEAWHDSDFDDAHDSEERALGGWTVDLYQNGQLMHSTVTDAGGAYRIIGAVPNNVSGGAYELRFVAPGAGANTAMLGLTASPFANGMQRITAIVVPPGANLLGLNLPIDPNGVIYNSVARIPVVGASLTLLDGRSAPLPSSCFNDTAQQGQITLADGYYKFDVNFSDPACPSGGDYIISVNAPSGTNYVPGYSQMIPARSNASTSPFSVPACPAGPFDAVPATAAFCEVQPSALAPAASVPALSNGTIHYVHLTLDNSQMPGTSQLFNNHIPLDPQLSGSVAISKTTPLLNVTRGQLVPYVITVNNIAGQMLTDVGIVDFLPAGFSYVPGSGLIDGVATEPSVATGALSWSGLNLAGAQVRSVRLLLAVGAGVSEGEFVNRAQVINGASGLAISGEATATVRVMPDPTFDCTEVTGKVFNDINRNGIQDDGENGLPGVRVVTARGLLATTDQYGRYHITCAITPDENRGSNFVLKLDDRTLPSGFRMSTEQVQIQRVTRGKALKFNFGASIHRVVGIDFSDAVFEPGTTEIRIQWQPRMNLLLEELRKAPAVLRLSYIADTEDEALVEQRMETVKQQLTDAWGDASSFKLTIEPEVFWRRGAPPKR